MPFGTDDNDLPLTHFQRDPCRVTGKGRQTPQRIDGGIKAMKMDSGLDWCFVNDKHLNCPLEVCWRWMLVHACLNSIDRLEVVQIVTWWLGDVCFFPRSLEKCQKY